MSGFRMARISGVPVPIHIGHSGLGRQVVGDTLRNCFGWVTHNAVLKQLQAKELIGSQWVMFLL